MENCNSEAEHDVKRVIKEFLSFNRCAIEGL